jgi:hypothetical protein
MSWAAEKSRRGILGQQPGRELSHPVPTTRAGDDTTLLDQLTSEVCLSPHQSAPSLRLELHLADLQVRKDCRFAGLAEWQRLAS